MRRPRRRNGSDPVRAEPILILGVPRSGTTLLRVLLDSHPNIACGPETPWLAAHQPRSVGSLYHLLVSGRQGYCRSFGMDREVVRLAARRFVDRLMRAYARRRGKRRWAEKTPDDILHLAFLLELFPEAACLYLVRDGLDTAVSTCVVAEHRRGISETHERRLALGPRCWVENNPFHAVLRWQRWNALAEAALRGRNVLRISFEELVQAPAATMRRVCEFLGEPFEERMLDYAACAHDYPSWEWGSADVQHAGRVDASRAGRGRRELDATALAVLEPMARDAARALGRPEPCARLASLEEMRSARFAQFTRWVMGLARDLGLRATGNWSKHWEYPWLWFAALERLAWRRCRVVDLGSELSPMPWLLALLGARVTLIERDGRWVPTWSRLRGQLRVAVDWHIVDDDRIPLPAGSADVVTSFSVIEHQHDKAAAIEEAIRVLRPGGLFCLSFDVCQPERGMTFPEWNGRALTLEEFERLVWSHPGLAGCGRLAWNLDDIGPFLDWHRTTAPHHNYVVGAAVVRRAGDASGVARAS